MGAAVTGLVRILVAMSTAINGQPRLNCHRCRGALRHFGR
jgi:hypothetical protein